MCLAGDNRTSQSRVGSVENDPKRHFSRGQFAVLHIAVFIVPCGTVYLSGLVYRVAVEAQRCLATKPAIRVMRRQCDELVSLELPTNAMALTPALTNSAKLESSSDSELAFRMRI
jgi:hypothetical protein